MTYLIISHLAKKQKCMVFICLGQWILFILTSFIRYLSTKLLENWNLKNIVCSFVVRGDSWFWPPPWNKWDRTDEFGIFQQNHSFYEENEWFQPKYANGLEKKYHLNLNFIMAHKLGSLGDRRLNDFG